MAGAQFEYDETGNTFYYFVLSFFALVLIPATFYLWPKPEQQEKSVAKEDECRCPPCEQKRTRISNTRPWTGVRRKFIKLVFILLWVLFFTLLYKVATTEIEVIDYDPFEILGIDREATTSEIKKAYRKLSLKFHPDKFQGDPTIFVKIAKAYQALTDEEARKNWEEFGNPDGPTATTFGIALPSWIVERENSVWVLAAYTLVFMVVLPIVVGTWWYRSMKFSADQVLLSTTQNYFHFFYKTPNMILRRVIMILTASLEFDKSQNDKIQVRPSDNVELPLLMKELPYLMEKNKERPFCYPFAVKTRALIHAHLTRVPLPSSNLEEDKMYVLKKCPMLVNEMIKCIAQLVAFGNAGRISRSPRLDTIENCMRLCQLITQALWENKSPLLQLPHFSENMLRHCITKKRHVRTIRDLISMKHEERRALLRSLSDEEYKDVLNVCKVMPHVTMEVRSEVLDDEESYIITAGALVTVTVMLIRKSQEHMFEMEEQQLDAADKEEFEEEKEDTDAVNEQQPQQQPQQQHKKLKPWEKQQKKKKGGKQQNKRKVPQQQQRYIVKKQQQLAETKPPPACPGSPASSDVKDSPKSTPIANGSVVDSESSAAGGVCSVRRRRRKTADHEDDVSGSEEDLSMSEEEELEDEAHIAAAADSSAQDDGTHSDEDEFFDKFQKDIAKKERKMLEGQSRQTHAVHCPYYPEDKQEWWWLYVSDRKHHSLITAPCHVTSLRDEQELQLKFPAPPKVGVYTYSVTLRSDSYIDVDVIKNIKLDVKEAKQAETNHPQWDISSAEEDDKEDEFSDYTTDEDDSE